MQIWIDADACPRVIRDIILRACARREIVVTLVANQALRVPPSPFVRTMHVSAGADAADDRIVERLSAGDLVITADIPLAARVLARGAHALDPRGQAFDPGSIAERLAMRELLDTLRGAGVETGGPPPLDARDRQNFGNALDRFLARHAPRPAPLRSPAPD